VLAEKFIEGRVAGQRRWTERLISLRVEAAPLPFEAGQFTKVALPEPDGKMLARAYSFANPPSDPVYEFYYLVVPDGPLTPRLAALKDGDPVWLSPRPSGFLVLSEVPDAENLWLLSTGTGVAPFLSILRSEAAWARYRHIVLVEAVRHAEELAYRDSIEQLRQRYPGRFTSVVFVSREQAPPALGALSGRIPQAILDGRLETATGVHLSAASAQVMLCGNPDMVTDTVRALAQRGMKKHRRRSPGQITVENYW
jgi:ferredoxin--NADP+ reductase